MGYISTVLEPTLNTRGLETWDRFNFLKFVSADFFLFLFLFFLLLFFDVTNRHSDLFFNVTIRQFGSYISL